MSVQTPADAGHKRNLRFRHACRAAQPTNSRCDTFRSQVEKIWAVLSVCHTGRGPAVGGPDLGQGHQLACWDGTRYDEMAGKICTNVPQLWHLPLPSVHSLQLPDMPAWLKLRNGQWHPACSVCITRDLVCMHVPHAMKCQSTMLHHSMTDASTSHALSLASTQSQLPRTVASASLLCSSCVQHIQSRYTLCIPTKGRCS